MGILALAGCRAVPEAPASQQLVAAQESDAPTLTVESLDNSIPLGDSFPILVKLDNMPPNQEITLQMENAGITPSVYEASVTSDSLGHAELRLSGRATRARLDALNVLAFFEDGIGTAADLLLVNFEPPYEGELQAAQVDEVIGEPITHEEYVSTLPEANSFEELAAYESNPPPALLLNGISFPEEDGSIGEPLNLLEYNAGSQTGDGIESTQASGCSSGNTYVYARTYISGAMRPMPAGTKVFISGDAPDQTRYVGSNGKLCFTFSSGKRIDFRVQGWTSTGIYLHDSYTPNGWRLVSWLRTWFAPSGGTLTASNVLGDALNLARSSSDSWYRSLRVFWKANQVYNWERTVPNNPYSTFPLSVVYPDRDLYTTRAYYGQMYIDEGQYSQDRAIFHEFGHEVYYRRLLGADTYRSYHEKAVKWNDTRPPSCVGSLGWGPWKHTDGCAGMLEGFALWFESVTTRALGSTPLPDSVFNPENGVLAGTAKGAAVPERVGQYLWDITDAHSGASPIVRDLDADEVRDTRSDVRQRYASVVRYFYNAPTNETFTYMFRNRINPNLPSDQRDEHCAVVRRNTLAVTGMCD